MRGTAAGSGNGQHHRRSRVHLLRYSPHKSRHRLLTKIKKSPGQTGPYPESRTLNKKTSCCRMKSTTGGLAMPRNYTKVEHLSAEILRRKHAGETNRQIAESYHLTVEQVKNLVTRQNRKMRLVERGYTLRRKGRPARKDADELTTLRNECIELRMRAEVLQNFLSEAGRR